MDAKDRILTAQAKEIAELKADNASLEDELSNTESELYTVTKHLRKELGQAEEREEELKVEVFKLRKELADTIHELGVQKEIYASFFPDRSDK